MKSEKLEMRSDEWNPTTPKPPRGGTLQMTVFRPQEEDHLMQFVASYGLVEKGISCV